MAKSNTEKTSTSKQSASNRAKPAITKKQSIPQKIDIDKEAAELGTRKLKTPKYKTFKLQRRIKHPGPKLPSAPRLFIDSLKILGKNWKVFGGIIIVYGLLVLLLVGLSGGDLSATKANIEQLAGHHNSNIQTSTTLFTTLVTNSTSTSNSPSGVYQIVFLLTGSLALIWALRRVYLGERVRIRDSYYKGMYPLVPFILVLLVIGLQLIPLLFGIFLYTTVNNGQIIAFPIEHVLWGAVLFLLVLLSLYMICSSIFALYIATLPNMTPMRALRSARELVRYRRWTVLRKILFLPIVLLVVACIIMLPAVLFVTSFAQWIFFMLGILALVVVHSYIYTVYRALL